MIAVVIPYPQTRASLLCRLKDPVDSAAWGKFVDVYGPLVYGEIRRRGVSHQDTEDVTQEVFARLLKSIRHLDYDPTHGRFRDWLGVVVRNEVFRFWRDRGRETADSVVIQDEDLLYAVAQFNEPVWQDHFHARILEVALDLCRDRFDPLTWEAFTRVWLKHQSASEVAIELQHPVEGVYVAKSRVLKALRKAVLLLADDWPFDNDRAKPCDNDRAKP